MWNCHRKLLHDDSSRTKIKLKIHSDCHCYKHSSKVDWFLPFSSQQSSKLNKLLANTENSIKLHLLSKQEDKGNRRMCSFVQIRTKSQFAEHKENSDQKAHKGPKDATSCSFSPTFATFLRWRKQQQIGFIIPYIALLAIKHAAPRSIEMKWMQTVQLFRNCSINHTNEIILCLNDVTTFINLNFKYCR